MEYDLAMWTISFARDPFTKMMEGKRRPLIAHVLWSKDDVGQINFLIKRIFGIFVNYVSIDFPDDKLAILVVSICFRFNG